MAPKREHGSQRRVTLPAPQNYNQAMAAINVLVPALRASLERLREAQSGSQSVEWLDDLERLLIRNAKGAIADALPLEDDAAGTGIGIEIVQATLDIIRRQVGLKDQDC